MQNPTIYLEKEMPFLKGERRTEKERLIYLF